MPAITWSSVEKMIRTISENASVKIARYGPLIRRQTHPMKPPTAQHNATPAAMPRGIGIPVQRTSRADAYPPTEANAMWPRENSPVDPARSDQLAVRIE